MTDKPRELKAILYEYDADPVGRVRALDELQRRAKDGIPTQKASPKGDVVDLIEKHPSLELACIKEKRAIWEANEADLAKHKADQQIDIRLTLAVPSTDLEDDEDDYSDLLDDTENP